MKFNSSLLMVLFLFISFSTSAQLAIEHYQPPMTLESMINYEFKVKYTSDRDINIFFEFKKAPDQSFGFANVRAQAGTDQIITVPITANSLPPEGNDYFIRTYFFENGSIVTGTVTDVTGIEMTINVTEDKVDFKRPPTQLFSQTNYNIDLAYEAVQERDLILELWSGAGKLGEVRKTVPGGANTETLTLMMNQAPNIGEGYFYKAFVVPTGETTAAATAIANDFTGVSVVDFLGDPCGDEIEEANGLVIIEAEDFDISGTAWQRRTLKTQYTGISYLEWLGNDFFNTPGNGLISAKIKITKTGKYRFQWRNRVGFGNSGSEHNDSWLKFPDVPPEDFYGEKPGGARTYPRGSGLTPNPRGAGDQGWFKIYANSLDWNFNATTGDFEDGRPVYVEFDAPGTYTLQISGRSKNHLIDRIILHNEVSNPTDLDTTPSNCSSVLGVSDFSLSDFGIISYPNPVSDVLFINGLELGDMVDILDVSGRVVIKEGRAGKEAVKDINIAHLVSGMYFLRVRKKGTQGIIIE
ncbi:T9SS C-terminal target domain-containing protein [Aquimarina sp. BL5]|uniref:T9SS type A sorting domain-containing protein n=1 Tax=Aquimarina sp. BL5 TaxID=1714860 RepID=UPI000E52DE5A|nr:T9SS type A sorting domain-containing protein [Aquimarina sp. BL5]AXT52679.1 T9SS C-terminal target domain-containing protein [Aquimarina sp. BL5]RKN11743.1 T9SS C-terminal target domain-containing protein [Aquimarina sp. BL5]